jgi:hypothetical protein
VAFARNATWFILFPIFESSRFISRTLSKKYPFMVLKDRN